MSKVEKDAPEKSAVYDKVASALASALGKGTPEPKKGDPQSDPVQPKKPVATVDPNKDKANEALKKAIEVRKSLVELITIAVDPLDVAALKNDLAAFDKRRKKAPPTKDSVAMAWWAGDGMKTANDFAAVAAHAKKRLESQAKLKDLDAEVTGKKEEVDNLDEIVKSYGNEAYEVALKRKSQLALNAARAELNLLKDGLQEGQANALAIASEEASRLQQEYPDRAPYLLELSAQSLRVEAIEKNADADQVLLSQFQAEIKAAADEAESFFFDRARAALQILAPKIQPEEERLVQVAAARVLQKGLDDAKADVAAVEDRFNGLYGEIPAAQKAILVLARQKVLDEVRDRKLKPANSAFEKYEAALDRAEDLLSARDEALIVWKGLEPWYDDVTINKFYGSDPAQKAVDAAVPKLLALKEALADKDDWGPLRGKVKSAQSFYNKYVDVIEKEDHSKNVQAEASKKAASAMKKIDDDIAAARSWGENAFKTAIGAAVWKKTLQFSRTGQKTPSSISGKYTLSVVKAAIAEWNQQGFGIVTCWVPGGGRPQNKRGHSPARATTEANFMSLWTGGAGGEVNVHVTIDEADLRSLGYDPESPLNINATINL